MTAFILLPSGVRSLFSLWAVLLCIGFIGSGVYALSHLRRGYAAGSFILLLLPYSVFQICCEISDYNLSGSLSAAALPVAQLPYIVYILAMAALTALDVLRLYCGYRYSETHITPKSVKQAADDLPTGVVYYFEDGQIFLFNHKMNDLDLELFRHPLRNGAKFAMRLEDRQIFESGDGTVYRFTKNKSEFRGAPLYEIIAEDITELYRKNQALRADNQALRQYNRRMRQYGEKIGDTVRREEILKAKVHIHDEMNRILLTIGNALKHNTPEERQSVLRELQTNALLLCAEADDSGAHPLNDLYTLAKSIGIALHMKAVPALEGKALHIFAGASRECILNAVKHAEAKNITVEFSEARQSVTAVFTNDGKAPGGPVTEGGGLRELRRKTEACGGSMQTEGVPAFRLTITLPREEKTNEL